MLEGKTCYYVKLQQAYFSEASKAGGWQLIGYQAPNGGSTTNFTYSGDITAAGSDALEAAKVGSLQVMLI